MSLVAPVYTHDLSVLYGIYLLFTLGCTYYVIYKWQKENGAKSDKQSSQWQENKPKMCAFLVVACLFWFQDRYRHHYSFEASAQKTLTNLFSAWEVGNKGQVIKTFEKYEGAVKPWNPPAEDSNSEQ